VRDKIIRQYKKTHLAERSKQGNGEQDFQTPAAPVSSQTRRFVRIHTQAVMNKEQHPGRRVFAETSINRLSQVRARRGVSSTSEAVHGSNESFGS
jgi:hypothetical protein